MVASPNLPRLHAAPPEGEIAPEGFAIRLPSAQLGDLIQINCINRVRGAFRVSSEGRQGYLFFEGGQLIHADFGAVTGLDAVVQMLSWRSGSIEPCHAPWPHESTIDMGADALLLCAAQRLDEMPLRPSGIALELTTKVVRRVAIEADARDGEADRSGRAALEAEQDPERPSIAPTHEQLSQLQVAQLTFDGVVRQLKCGATLDLADTGFFSQRMAASIGETLGLGDCLALFLEGSSDSVVVIKGRTIVATRGSKAALAFILGRVGLA
jgi:hypothetical protein